MDNEEYVGNITERKPDKISEAENAVDDGYPDEMYDRISSNSLWSET